MERVQVTDLMRLVARQPLPKKSPCRNYIVQTALLALEVEAKAGVDVDVNDC